MIGWLKLIYHNRVHHGGKDYVVNEPYFFTENGFGARLGVLNLIALCTTTSELYFNVNYYRGEVCYLEGHMPSVDLSLGMANEWAGLHHMQCIERVVLHRPSCELLARALVRGPADSADSDTRLMTGQRQTGG